MAAAGAPGEDAALYDTVQRGRRSSCARALGIAHSRSARTRCRCAPRGREARSSREVVAPRVADRLGLRAVRDVRGDADAASCAATAARRCWCSSDLGRGKHRLGGSVLAQVYGQRRRRAAGSRRSGARCAASSRRSPSCGATSSCSPTTTARTAACSSRCCEMAFAGHCGVEVDAGGADPRRPCRADALAGLFAEELGAVLQVRDGRRDARHRAASRRHRARRRASSARPADDDAIAWCSTTGGALYSRARASTCSRPGARRPGRCSRCATTRAARARSTTGSLDADDPGPVSAA